MTRLAAIFDAMIKAATVRTWALIAAGPVQIGFAAWLVTIIAWGRWLPAQEPQRLWFLGTALLTTLGVNAVIVVALAAARVSGHGPGGISLDIASGAEPPPTNKITVTTTAETKT